MKNAHAATMAFLRAPGGRIAPVLLLLVGVACNGDGGTDPTPTPADVVVSPPSATLTAVGATEQFAAQVLDSNGQPLSGVSVAWTSNSGSVAEVDQNGLVTARGKGSTTITATAGSASGTATVEVDPRPTSVVKVAGDNQSADAGTAVGVNPTVEVRDANGVPIPAVAVTFSVVAGNGSVAPASVQTGPGGRASTSWTLGPVPGAPQTLRASAGGLTADFTATATLNAPRIGNTSLADGRLTLAYGETLQASGGSGTGYVWSVVGGALPIGLNLGAGGDITGVPTALGTADFTVQVEDSDGTTATRGLSIRVCEAPLALAVGQVSSLAPPASSQCGFFIPSGQNGDLYRVAVMRTTLSEASTDVVQATLTVSGQGTTAAPPAGLGAQGAPWIPELRLPSAAMDRALETERTTAAFHAELRRRESEMVDRIGAANLRLLPSLTSGLAVAGPFRAAAPARRVFDTSTQSNCAAGEQRVGLLVAENQHLAVYQDSIQRSTAPASPANVQRMLDYYRDHGKPVVDAYWGGVSDVNGDNQIVVFISPVASGGIAAFVWSGDMLTKQQCAASNEMELVFFNNDLVTQLGGANPNFQALSTVVHEAKHVSSLYKRTRYIINNPGTGSAGFHPQWVEEGTAEISAEMSSRRAWAAAGGPAINARITRQPFVDAGGFTAENFGVVIRMVRTLNFFTSHPNALTVDPSGPPSLHFYYGPAWHFVRFLGDAYGNAAQGPQADANFFKMQNDSVIAPGAAGFQQLTGKNIDTLLQEWLTGVMLVGTGAPQPQRAYTTYDYVTSAEIFAQVGQLNGQGVPDPVGVYPWPVTTTGADDPGVPHQPLVSAVFSGSMGPGGIRVHDFQSNGSGSGAAVNVDVPQPARVLVTRLR